MSYAILLFNENESRAKSTMFGGLSKNGPGHNLHG